VATRFPRVTSVVQPWRAYVPVLIIVIAGALITAWAGDGFIDLAERVHAKSPKLQQIDTRVHDWAIHERTAGATPFFVTVTNVGGPLGDAVFVAIAAIILAIQRRWSWLIYLGVTTAGGVLLNEELKRYFAPAPTSRRCSAARRGIRSRAATPWERWSSSARWPISGSEQCRTGRRKRRRWHSQTR
jgi:hypothetical protein